MNVARTSQRGADRARIAITGVGAITAIGVDATTTFDCLIRGERGFRPVSLFDVSPYRCKFAAEVPNLPVVEAAMHGVDPWSRTETMALLAAREALHGSRIDPRTSPIALVMGTTNTWIYEAEQLYANGGSDPAAVLGRHMVQHPQGDAADRLAAALGGVFRRTTLCSACSTGALAVAAGASWLELGLADRVLVGGSDSLCLLTYAGFEAIGVLSSKPCQPFDTNRSGMSIGEGAGFLVLEREADALARGADVVAWLSGWAVGSEAHHATLPETSGATATRLFTQALRHARLEPAHVDYVNAHGTGTLANDAMEARAIRASMGKQAERIWVSSCKGQIGHALAAAGAIEAVLCALSVQRGIVPPTLGLTDPDASEPLRHVREKGVLCPVRVALSSSFGFGGNGIVLAFEHSSRQGFLLRESVRRRTVFLSSPSVWHDESDVSSGEIQVDRCASRVAPRDALSVLDPNRSRRFDLFSALITANTERVLRKTGLDPQETGLVVGFCYGHVERLSQFLERITPPGPRKAAPAEFPHVIPSSSTGNASVYLGLKGPTFVVADARLTSESTLDMAACLVRVGAVEAMVVGVASMDDPVVGNAIASLSDSSTVDFAGVAAAAVAVVSERCAVRLGISPVAELVIATVLREASYAERVLEDPLHPRESAIIYLGRDDRLERALLHTAWSKVRRILATPLRGAPEASGLVALDQAMRVLEQGMAREVLVWTECGSAISLVQARAWVGSRPEPSGS